MPRWLLVLALTWLLWPVAGEAACTPAQLQTELTTDPAVPPLGYAPAVTAGNDAELVRLLNEIREGTAFQIDQVISREHVYRALVDSELLTFDAPHMDRLNLALTQVQFDMADPGVRNKLRDAVPASATQSRANLNTIRRRQGSRAEVVCGRGTVVTQSEVSFALRGAQ
jgi:hypothetical protein